MLNKEVLYKLNAKGYNIEFKDSLNYMYNFSETTVKKNIQNDRSGFDIFSVKNKFSLENIRNWIVLNNIKIKLISCEYNGVSKPMEWECSKCNKRFHRSFDKVKNSNQILCTDCSRNSRTNKVKHDFENVKSQLKTFGYDFFIPHLNLLIEVDGKQHFEHGGDDSYFNRSKFEEIQNNDKKKNDYALKNNIKLVRIPYYKYEKEEYKEILINELLINN